MSQLISGKTNYDSNKEYYFLDYQDSMDLRWVRSPYMTMEEIQHAIANDLPFIYDKDQEKCIPMFSNLRVTPMARLEELYQVWNEDTQKWEDDTITLAAKQFGGRYDGYDWLEGPSPSLSKQDDETTEEWKVRVQQRNDELAKQIKEKNISDRQNRQKAKADYPNEGIALLHGWRRRKDELNAFQDALQDEQVSDTAGVGFGL